MRSYVGHTISAAYRCTGKRQLDLDDRQQVYVYIKSLQSDGELSNKVRGKHVVTMNDLDLLIDTAFSDAYNLGVQSIRIVLNIALYMNLFVDVCGRGSDLAWGGPLVAEQENHSLCWGHCHFFVVNVNDGDDRSLAANIDIKYQKGQQREDVQRQSAFVSFRRRWLCKILYACLSLWLWWMVCLGQAQLGHTF
jgi:hypothetical protein